MKKYSEKLVGRGFTLVEVMIGMMILVVAIVTATSLLINIMNSNKMIANHLKAYYLAQEGIEAVRNARDTNWLNNRDWKSSEIFTGLGPGLDFDTSESGAKPVYSVQLMSQGWGNSSAVELDNMSDLGGYLPWDFAKQTGGFDYNNQVFIVKNVLQDKNLYPEFYRYIEFEEYDSPACEEDDDECNEDFILARSVVKWRDLGREYNVTLEEVLSNWKGGAL